MVVSSGPLWLTFIIINHNHKPLNTCQPKSPCFSKYIFMLNLTQKKRRQAVFKTKDDVVVLPDCVKFPLFE